jgi:hypothetical protein
MNIPRPQADIVSLRPDLHKSLAPEKQATEKKKKIGPRN